MVGMSAAVFGLARQSYLTEAVPFHFRARALSTLGGVMRIGLFVGPFLAAALIHAMGIAGAYWAGVGSLVCAALVAARMPDLPARPAADATTDVAAVRAPRDPRSVARDHREDLPHRRRRRAPRRCRACFAPGRDPALGRKHRRSTPRPTSLIYGLASGIEMLVFYPAGKVMDQRGRALGRRALDA